jgi:RHS repeat-associated protein
MGVVTGFAPVSGSTRRFPFRWLMGIALAVLCPVHVAWGATSGEIVTALGLQEHVVAHSLTTATLASHGICETSLDNAVTDPAGKSVLISNGDAQDGGLGSGDWTCPDGSSGAGSPDYTQFQMTLRVPAGMRSLTFRTQFITGEFGGPGSVNDRALLSVAVPGGVPTQQDLGSAASVSSQTSPAILRSINVEGHATVQVSFRVEDQVNGAMDSALKILDVQFSAETTPGQAVVAGTEDIKMPAGTYRYSKQLLFVPGKGLPLDFTIHYNSRALRTRYFFRKWTHSYEWSLHRLADGDIVVVGGDGGAVYFCPTGTAGGYAECNGSTDTSFDSSWRGTSATLTVSGGLNGGYTYTNREQLRYEFDDRGRLTRIVDLNDNALSFTHFDYTYPNPQYCTTNSYLQTIQDTRGGTLELFYSTDPTNFCAKMVVSMEYRQPERSVFLATTYQLVTDCFNRSVLDLAYVDGLEGQTVFSYDCAGNLLTATDPDGVRFTSNTYAGDLTASKTDGKGAVESYLYAGDTISYTDRAGAVNRFDFDSRDRLIRQTDPLGQSWQYTYDERGNRTGQTDPRGHSTTMQYDDRGNLLATTDALGHVSRRSYDGRNNVVQSTDAAGQTTTYTYDASDNLVREADPNGHAVTYTHEAGQVKTVTDPRGGVSRYEYSSAGDLTKETDALGHSVSQEYDWRGRRIASIDARGHRTSRTYDAPGNLLSTVRPDGSFVRNTYDSQGRRLSMETATGAVTRYEYSETGKMFRLVDPLANVFEFEYDAEDRLVAQGDPLGRVTAFEHDAAGRMVRVMDAAGGIARAAYDAAGNRTSATDPRGNTVRYEYDALNRPTAQVDPLGNRTTTSYDPRGLTTRSVNARGGAVGFQYDPAGRLVRTEHPGHAIERTLDASGNEVRTVGKAGATIRRSFDATDRLVSRTDQFGNTIGYAYDAAGNLIALTYSDGKVVRYGYDSLNRLVQVIDWQGNETTYTYDLAGKLRSTTLPDGSTILNTYDIAGQLTGTADTGADGEAIFAADFEYNGAGLATRTTYHARPLVPRSHRARVGLSYDAANQLGRVDGKKVSHDADGNLIAGPIGGQPRLLAYDEMNRLTRVGWDSYEYDPEGLRVRATLGKRTVRYVQDPNAPYSRLLEEHDARGNILARYVYGVGLVSRQDSAGHVSVYHFDTRGSTVALTDLSGTLTDRYAYDAYGRVAGREGRTPNPFTYDGRDGVLDDGNGLYFMRARYYEPELMRFLQRDPGTSGNLMDPQTLNRYAYVRGNPVQLVDPTGEILPIIVGMAAGVASEIAFDWVTGEFNPLEDNWGVYLEDNWLELSVSAALGGLGPLMQMKQALNLAKLAKLRKKLPTVLLKNADDLALVGRVSKDLGKSLANWGLFPRLQGAALTGKDFLQEWGTDLWEDSRGVARDVIEGLGGVATDVGQGVKKAAKKLSNWVSSWF